MMQLSVGTRETELYGSARERPDLCDEWLRFIKRNIHLYRLDSRAPMTPSFRVHGRVRSVGGFTVVRGITVAGKCSLRRDSAQIADDGQTRFGLYVSLRGGMEIAQFGRKQLVTPGSYTCVSTSEPATYNKSGQSDMITFFMPRDFVEERVANAERICMQTRAGGAGLQGLVFESIHAFAANAWELTDIEFEKSAQAIGNIVLLALDNPADPHSSEHSVRAANLSRVKRHIRRNLSDPELSLERVAVECGLSLSYTHELFRFDGDGRTMREYLTDERLQRARELLELAPAGKTITAIAMDCGISNMSYFSTAFRRAFGLTPRQVTKSR